ncbi:hypothetical protein [Streptomyces sp. NPDC057301]|uniref:hypothetical protein n=1 Tax=Streptomyces sp. NPDC057301 TaxID=3346093 RepID=UPI0036331F6A
MTPPPAGHAVALPCTARVVELRELTGAVERTVNATSTSAAVTLLDGICLPRRDGPAATTAALPAADRDRLLLAAHRRAFGDRIEATVRCRACRSPFDLDFTLSALETALDAAGPPEALPDADGWYSVAGYGRFRLPTGADEIAVAGLDGTAGVAELVRRCVPEPHPGFDPDGFQDLLGRLAPLADLDLDCACPECGTGQPVHFDIQSYFLSALLADRRRLVLDVHRLACAYRWSHREILELPRAERRALVALVEAQPAAPSRSWRLS